MFELSAPYQPAGDQPQAIAKLTEGVVAGARHQTLVGVTGSGKTFTVANVIQAVQKPTLVISHNKTIITSPRPTSRAPTLLSRRIPASTKRSNGCGSRP
jgi:excinuclease UvrABC helicase subunit UvrB